jgi:hypothetical protein
MSHWHPARLWTFVQILEYNKIIMNNYMVKKLDNLDEMVKLLETT